MEAIIENQRDLKRQMVQIFRLEPIDAGKAKQAPVAFARVVFMKPEIYASPSALGTVNTNFHHGTQARQD